MVGRKECRTAVARAKLVAAVQGYLSSQVGDSREADAGTAATPSVGRVETRTISGSSVPVSTSCSPPAAGCIYSHLALLAHVHSQHARSDTRPF